MSLFYGMVCQRQRHGDRALMERDLMLSEHYYIESITHIGRLLDGAVVLSRLGHFSLVRLHALSLSVTDS